MDRALRGLLTWIERGGPLMWPLLALSLITLAVVLERLLFWLREGRVGPQVALQISLRKLGLPGAGEGDVEAALSFEQRRLERGLAWVDTAITAAPLMGILGTVLGIIDSFQLLGTSAAVDPLSLSGGVAKALVTTATGLSIALVSLFPFNLLLARTERRMEELERAGRVYLGDGSTFDT